MGLLPFSEQASDEEAPSVPMLFADYVELLEWTGRAVREAGPTGQLGGPPPSVMQRLGLEPSGWLRTMSPHGLRSLGALGRAESLEALAQRQGKRWVKGQRWARKLFAAA